MASARTVILSEESGLLLRRHKRLGLGISLGRVCWAAPSAQAHDIIAYQLATPRTRSLDQAYQLLLLDLATHEMDAPEAFMRKFLTIWVSEAFGRSTTLAGFDDGQALDTVLKEIGISS